MEVWKEKGWVNWRFIGKWRARGFCPVIQQSFMEEDNFRIPLPTADLWTLLNCALCLWSYQCPFNFEFCGWWWWWLITPCRGGSSRSSLVKQRHGFIVAVNLLGASYPDLIINSRLQKVLSLSSQLNRTQFHSLYINRKPRNPGSLNNVFLTVCLSQSQVEFCPRIHLYN